MGVLQRIIDEFAAVRARYPHITDEDLDSGGAIFYMNGNDGTEFDWIVNSMTSEFFIFFNPERGGRGFIKINVFATDEMRVCVYPDGGAEPAEYYSVPIGPGEAAGIVRFLYEAADMNGHFDKPVYVFYRPWEVTKWTRRK